MKGWKNVGNYAADKMGRQAHKEANRYQNPGKPFSGKADGTAFSKKTAEEVLVKKTAGELQKDALYARQRFGLGRELGFLALTGILIMAVPFQSYASEKISSIKVKFELGEPDEDGIPGIESDSENGKYSVNEILTLEEYEDEWDEDNDDDDDDNDDDKDKEDNSDLLAYNDTYRAMGQYSQLVYAVQLEASGDYYFLKDKDKIKLTGLGAELVRLERLDDKETLVLFVRFADLDGLAGTIETAAWSGDGRGTWSAGAEGLWYEVRLYLNGKAFGEKKVTGGTTYDFRPLMQKEGSFYYTVRQVSASGDTGEAAQSGSVTVTAEQAEKNKTLYGVKTEQTGTAVTPASEVVYLNTGWQTAADGRLWYRDTDGSYPQANWINKDGVWYYFDSDGYLVKGTYVPWGKNTYYVDADGHMLTSGKAPDGRMAQTDGVLKWPES